MSSRTATPVAAHSLDKRELFKFLPAFRRGDFSVRRRVESGSPDAKIAETLNEIIELNQKMVREFSKISTAVGKEGRINQRARLGDQGGGWAECVDSINTLIVDVVQPSAQVARVIGAAAKCDLSL